MKRARQYDVARDYDCLRRLSFAASLSDDKVRHLGDASMLDSTKSEACCLRGPRT